MYAWGRGEHGVLGLGSDSNQKLPVPVMFGSELGLVRVKMVACSWFHTVCVCVRARALETCSFGVA
jgi:hypothetical protein